MNEADIDRISSYIGLTKDEFIAQFTDGDIWLQFSQRVLLSDTNNTGCIFLSDVGCNIYPVRPELCAKFPREDQIDDELTQICERAKEMNLNSTITSAIGVFNNCAFRFFDEGGYGINFKDNRYYFLNEISARLVNEIITKRGIDTKSIADEYGVDENVVIFDAIQLLRSFIDATQKNDELLTSGHDENFFQFFTESNYSPPPA